MVTEYSSLLISLDFTVPKWPRTHEWKHLEGTARKKKSASWTSTETERGRITCPLFETLIKMPFYPLQKNLFLKTVSLQNDSCPCRAVPDFLPCLLHLWDSQNMLTVIYEIEKEKRNILKHNVETKNFSCQEEDE